MDNLSNLFDTIPLHVPHEVVQTLLSAPMVRVERIVSKGHASPPDFWYDQDEHEWVLLIQGAARLQFEDRTMDLKPGDFVNIPARQRHRVDWTDSTLTTLWLAIFYKDSNA